MGQIYCPIILGGEGTFGAGNAKGVRQVYHSITPVSLRIGGYHDSVLATGLRYTNII